MKDLVSTPFLLPRLITIVGTTLLLAATLLYILFQARFLITGPQITLTDEPPSVTTDRTITLTGTSRNITAIYLNDRPIVTNEVGMFAEVVVLENGYTPIRLRALDRYGRETTLDRTFVYTPPEGQ